MNQAMNRRAFLSVSAGLAAAHRLPAAEPLPPAGPGFQLGCVTYELLKNMDLDAVIQTLETAGLAAVELRTGHKHGVEPSLGAAERTRVRERFQRSKVKLLSYGTTCEFQSPDTAERRKQIDL